jgi:hypothetical protein
VTVSPTTAFAGSDTDQSNNSGTSTDQLTVQ